MVVTDPASSQHPQLVSTISIAHTLLAARLPAGQNVVVQSPKIIHRWLSPTPPATLAAIYRKTTGRGDLHSKTDVVTEELYTIHQALTYIYGVDVCKG